MHSDLSRSSWDFFRKIFEFLFPPTLNTLFGKLFVSGKGALEFTFKNCPQDVYVYFDDECYSVPCTPCDPGQTDLLEWHIVEHKHHFTLCIEWEVESMRAIYWKVCS